MVPGQMKSALIVAAAWALTMEEQLHIQEIIAQDMNTKWIGRKDQEHASDDLEDSNNINSTDDAILQRWRVRAHRASEDISGRSNANILVLS